MLSICFSCLLLPMLWSGPNIMMNCLPDHWTITLTSTGHGCYIFSHKPTDADKIWFIVSMYLPKIIKTLCVSILTLIVTVERLCFYKSLSTNLCLYVRWSKQLCRTSSVRGHLISPQFKCFIFKSIWFTVIVIFSVYDLTQLTEQLLQVLIRIIISSWF